MRRSFPSKVDLQALERQWYLRNLPFTENDFNGPEEGPDFEITVRDPKLIVTAVHAVKHSRPSQPSKPNDANTGGLAAVVAEEVGYSVAIVRRARGTDDANSTDDHPLKRALVEQLDVTTGATVIDLHGMSDATKFDVAVGIGVNSDESRMLALSLSKVFRAYGLVVDHDGSATGLRANRPGTMTRWAQGRGAVALQIEIARRCRSFLVPIDDRIRLLSALRESLLTTLP